MMKKPSKTVPSVWMFFKPFPISLWLGIIGALIVTAIVMFLIHNIEYICQHVRRKIKSSREKDLRDYNFQVTDIEDDVEHVHNTKIQLRTETPTVNSEFSVLDSLWYMVASFMQQGSSMEPR